MSNSRKQTGEPAHPVDVHVGRRLKAARTSAGLTQTVVAEAVGLKFQQIQKYESGYNRISASKLYEISKLTGRPVAWFFEGLEWAEGRYTPNRDEPMRLSEWKFLMAFRTLPEEARDSLAKFIRLLPSE